MVRHHGQLQEDQAEVTEPEGLIDEEVEDNEED